MASSLVQRGVQKDFWPGSGVRGGCPGVGVGLCWWFKLVLALGCLPFALPPWCLVVRGGGRAPLLPCTSPFWALEKSPINFSLGPWSGSATHVTSTGHFSHRLFGGGGGFSRGPSPTGSFRGGASPAAPLPPPLPLSHNFCHRLRASRILAHRDKSHHFHSRGAHFPPGLKMRCAEGLISSSKG